MAACRHDARKASWSSRNRVAGVPLRFCSRWNMIWRWEGTSSWLQATRRRKYSRSGPLRPMQSAKPIATSMEMFDLRCSTRLKKACER